MEKKGNQEGRNGGDLGWWCWHLLGVGAILGLAGLSLYRGVQADELRGDVENMKWVLEELRDVVRSLQEREGRVEKQLVRTRRQVGLSSRPEVLDQSYGASLPQSTANLTIYGRWGSKGGSSSGVSSHHQLSAAWPGQDQDQTSGLGWQMSSVGQSSGVGQSSDDGQSYGVGQNSILEQNTGLGQNSGLGQAFRKQDIHRRSRVASTRGGGHGVIIEIPGNLLRSGGGNSLPTSKPLPTPTRPPTRAPSPTTTTSTTTSTSTTTRPVAAPSPTYKRPQLKSLGRPDRPTRELTAVQLEAGQGGHQDPGFHKTGLHSHWKLARWAKQLGSAERFPLSGGEVGVPTPGLYLVYAQVSYSEKLKHLGFSVRVNSQSVLHCDQRRGVGLQISCYTGGLLYLEQGDRVSVVDSRPGHKVDTRPGKTFFGLVKLTRDWI